MKINKSTVYNWIKALNKKIEEQKSEPKEEDPKEIMEMDELYSCVERKKEKLSDNVCNKETEANCRI